MFKRRQLRIKALYASYVYTLTQRVNVDFAIEHLDEIITSLESKDIFFNPSDRHDFQKKTIDLFHSYLNYPLKENPITDKFLSQIIDFYNELNTKLYLHCRGQLLSGLNIVQKCIEDLLNKEIEIIKSESITDKFNHLSIFWEENSKYMIRQVLDILNSLTKDCKNKKTIVILSAELKEGEDFCSGLFDAFVKHQNEYIKQITESLVNWKMERVSLLDLTILKLALTEFLFFPEIPPKVVLNEYIDISKHFGGEKSGNFVNGVLDRIYKDLKPVTRIS